MSNRAGRNGKTLSVLVFWMIVASSVIGVLAALTPAAQAGVCDQVGGVITGDWTITTAQTCTGIVYTVDGTINVNAGGSLTLVNGGLKFAKDGSHQAYALNVNAGGAFVLDGSFVTSETNAINPYLHLAMTVSGTGSVTMVRGSMLEFPGWFNVTGPGAVVDITDSTITGFTDTDLAGLFDDPGQLDASNDAPLITWSSATASLYRSRVERLYEHTGTTAVHMSMVSSTSLYAYDSYISADYSNLATRHNELRVDGSSNAYLFNVTIDESQSPPARVDWQPAFRPTAAGGNVYILRWANVYALDSNGMPVGGATVWSRLSPGSATAQYPDNAMASTPSARTLNYLGKTAAGANAFNRTDSSGRAKIPLYTDQITTATLPNAESFGHYDEIGTYVYGGTYTATSDASFLGYPELAWQDNNLDVFLTFGAVQACPSGVTTWSTNRELTGFVSVSKTLNISGDVSITDGGLYMDQQADACAVVRILSGGSLILDNATVWSNYRLAVYVSQGATLTVMGASQLSLTQRGIPGILQSEGTTSVVSIEDSGVDGNLNLVGGTATLLGARLTGPAVTIDTSQKVNLWDSTFVGVTDLNLLTDDGNVNTVDFDIRNATFNQAQTGQLVFTGNQYVQLTSVSLYDPTNTWWTPMITGNSRVARYWWLTVRAVDGTGTLLANANATITVDRLDPDTLNQFAAPLAAGDVYYTSDLAWPARTASGQILYRAFEESRVVSLAGRVVNNSYVATASASIAGQGYSPDGPGRLLVTQDGVVALIFSALTPDLSVTGLTISGGNGNSPFQPLNTWLTLTAAIRNTGQIDVRFVTVSFFSDDVDKNSDNILDFSADDFRASAGIDDVVVPLIPKDSTVNVQAQWRPLGAIEMSLPVTVVVDPPLVGVDDGGSVRETNERNNILAPRTFTLFTWPDLTVTAADFRALGDPVVNNTVLLSITVSNEGTARATDAVAAVFDGATPVQGSGQVFTLDNGASRALQVAWRPTSTGNHTIRVVLSSDNATIRNADYNWTLNVATAVFQVFTQPDLQLRQSDFSAVVTPTQGQPFVATVVIHNIGQTSATGVTVAVYFDPGRTIELGRKANLSVRAGDLETTTVGLVAIDTPGWTNLTVYVDPDNTLNEGGALEEGNNQARLTVNVQPPLGSISVDLPLPGGNFQPGQQLIVAGFVRAADSRPIPNVFVEIVLMSGATEVAKVNTTSGSQGDFARGLPIPPTLADGPYTVVVRAPVGLIDAGNVQITVKKIVPFLDSPFPLLGLPMWMMLVIFGAVAAIIIGATLYFKFYGLGKMVECGECGAFIPEDATKCPKCGVEFEKDMAKCSNCQAWIPVDVKQCPECGVEFATGEVEMADYQEKMRLQYDEVVQKFKEEASRQLGRALSDREFQEWWRKQPTFVTFEDWLREEEEMRKMGSRPCPVCGTLNSVTATVCHKCGSLMRQEPRPPSGGGGGAPPAARPRSTAPAQAPPGAPSEEPPMGAQAAPGAGPPGTEAIPRRVIRRPIATQQPVVQKKVIKRPLEGGQQGEGTESQTSEENPEDEL